MCKARCAHGSLIKLFCSFQPSADPINSVDLSGSAEQGALEQVKQAFERQKSQLKLQLKQMAEKLADQEHKVSEAKERLVTSVDEAQAANKALKEKDIELYKKERDIIRLTRKVREFTQHAQAVEQSDPLPPSLMHQHPFSFHESMDSPRLETERAESQHQDSSM